MKKNLKNYFFCILGLTILLFCGQASAQDYAVDVQQFNTEDGLLHRSVLTVFEDKDGFIWLGFSKGVQRFDGHEFKSWTKSNANEELYEITAIGQDQAGWLWLYNNGLKRFVFLDPLTEKVLTQEERFGSDFPIRGGTSASSGGWHGATQGFPTDSKGRLYFASSKPNELLVFGAEKGFEHIPLPGMKADFIELFFIDSKDQIWMTESFTASTLHKVSLDGNILQSISYPGSYDIVVMHEYDQKILYKIVADGKNTYYEIDGHGKSRKMDHLQQGIRSFRSFSSLVWDYTEKGWAAYNYDSPEAIFTLESEEMTKTFANIRISIYEDSRGRFWFAGSWGLGLVTIKPSRFRKYFSFDEKTPKPFNNSARGIVVEKDTLYANFEFGGLVRIPKANPKDWVLLSDERPPHRNYTGRPILKSSSGSLYSGYEHSLLLEFLPNGTLINHFNTREEEDAKAHTTWSLFEDEQQGIWLGRGQKLSYKEPHENFLRDALALDSIIKAPLSLFQISSAGKDQLWICTNVGLFLFDSKNKTHLNYFGMSTEVEADYLPAREYYYLYTDADGIHWLGTNEGLLRWDREKNEKRLFSRIDGLSNDVIYAVFEDKHQRLWLSSDYGIMQFDKNTFNVNTYLEKDGISYTEFNRISAFQEADGTIYFGGLNGITAFHPDDFYEERAEQPYKMQIIGFEIFDGKASQLLNKVGELRQSNKIVFHPDDRFFRLKFVLPVIDDGSRLNYAWKVEGLDEEWNYQKENTLQIGKLPYGKHILRIKGQRADGHWSKHQLAIDVHVLKPFYLQNWFLLMAILGLIGGVYLFFRRRTQQYLETKAFLESSIEKATVRIKEDKQLIEEQADELRQLDRLKSRFFANVSHELRTPLTLILGPISSALKRGQLDNRDFTLLKKAQQNGNDLLKLIASILDLSKMEAGKMELQEQSTRILPYIRRIVSTFESHAQHSGIQLNFVYQAEKDLQIEIDREKLAVIINNLLSNAIKFTPREGKISFQFEDNARNIKLTLKDTGRGIHPNDLPHIFDRFYQAKEGVTASEGGTGIGLALSQEFVKLMEGKMWVESELGVGSSFFIELPRKEVMGIILEEHQVAMASEEVEDHLTPTATAPEKAATVLIVEDNYSLRDYLQGILSPYYHIVSAENGAAALRQIEAIGPASIQLILSDIMMPVMDGYQLLEAVKSSDELRAIPMVMLTARADIQGRLKALRIGVDDYLLKPFEEEELLARIDNLIKNYEARRAFVKEEEPAQVTAAESSRPPIAAEDQRWLEQCETTLKTELTNSNYSIAQMAHDFSMSESTLSRQTKRLTGLSPFRYLQELRLNEARRLIENYEFKTIAQVADKVGFSDANAFSRAFKKRFGKAPSAFAKT